MCGVVARPAEYDAVIQGRQSPLVDVFAVMGMRTFGILVLHLRRVAKGKNDRATARAPIFLTSKGQFLSYERELIGSGHLRSSSIASLLRALHARGKYIRIPVGDRKLWHCRQWATFIQSSRSHIASTTSQQSPLVVNPDAGLGSARARTNSNLRSALSWRSLWRLEKAFAGAGRASRSECSGEVEPCD